MEAALLGAPDDDTRSWRTEVISMRKKIENKDIEEFVKGLDFSVGAVSSGTLNTVLERLSDLIYLQTPKFSPKSFTMRIPENSPNFDRSESEFYPTYFEVQILSEAEDLGFPPFLLKRMTLTMSCQVPGASNYQVLEECSLWNKIEAKKAKIAPDGKFVRLWIKRPKNRICLVSIKMFNCNILMSPQGQHFLNDVTQDQISQNLSMPMGVANETGIEIFDICNYGNYTITNGLTMHHESLDRSDYNALDMTGRKNFQMMYPNLNLHNSVQASPGFHPMRRVSGDLQMNMMQSLVSLPPGD